VTGELEENDIPSLADATKEEMSQFLSNCLMGGAKMGLYIPSPEAGWKEESA